jgi:hypothetical protein
MKWKVRSKQELALCKLACYDKHICSNMYVGTCDNWDRIDPFKRTLIDIKIKRLQEKQND